MTFPNISQNSIVMRLSMRIQQLFNDRIGRHDIKVPFHSDLSLQNMKNLAERRIQMTLPFDSQFGGKGSKVANRNSDCYDSLSKCRIIMNAMHDSNWEPKFIIKFIIQESFACLCSPQPPKLHSLPRFPQSGLSTASSPPFGMRPQKISAEIIRKISNPRHSRCPKFLRWSSSFSYFRQLLC
jgi:hypothetical protein